ncbi:MAG: CHRD domain-containing protein [Gemmatimonadales bacterium]
MLRRLILSGGIAVFITGCTADQPEPTALEVRVPIYAQGGNGDFNLGTHLIGDEEVLATSPHPSVSPAQGQAIFRINAEGTSANFRLIASNIDNVTQAHIHCGLPGTNGPIAMWLYPEAEIGPPPGTAAPNGSGPQDGVLASGTFSLVGVDCPVSAFGAGVHLIDAIRDGRTYVNVHTNDGVTPTNTGPGDFPGGEIRGQLDDGN